MRAAAEDRRACASFIIAGAVLLAAGCGLVSFRDNDGQGGLPASGVADYAPLTLKICAAGKVVLPAAGTLSGFCMTPVAAGRLPCESDHDCLSRELCICGECRLQPCTSVECTPGLRCDGRSGRCLTSCPIPTSCPGGSACQDGFCLPRCGDDYDCAAGEYCDPLPCDSDAVCPVGDTCQCGRKDDGACAATGKCGRSYCLANRCRSDGECVGDRFAGCTGVGMTLDAPAVLATDTGASMLVERRDDTGNASIVRADSRDGFAWELDTSPVISPDADWEAGRVGAPSVFFDGSQVVMYFSGGDGAGIGLAVSDDGIAWQKYDGNPVFAVQGSGSESRCVVHADCPAGERCYTGTCLARWERGRVGSPSVLRTGDTYLMFYEGGQGAGIGLASAKDGLTFTRYQDDPILPLGPVIDKEHWYDVTAIGAPWVTVEPLWDGTVVFRMWFAGLGKESLPNPTNTEPRANLSIGYAASTNAIAWEVYKYNPVFDHLVLLNHLSENEPSIVKLGGKHHLYYADPDTGGIGAAVSGLSPQERAAAE